MVRASNFAEFVAQLSADDANLKKDLRSAETATKVSATKMQTNLNKVTVSAGNAGQALGAMGQGAAALGGQMGGAVGQGIAFTQMVGGLGIKMGLAVTSVVALAAAVVVYRKEIADAIIKTAEWAGAIDDVTGKQGRLDTVSKDLAFQLKLSQARNAIRSANELSSERLGVATAGGAAGLSEFDLQRKIDKQFRSLPGDLQNDNSRKALEETLRNRLSINVELVKEKTLQSDIADAEVKAVQAFAERTRLRKADRQEFATLEQRRAQAAQQMLVGLGAKPSEFIQDPVLKRLAALGESLQGGQQAPPGVTGSFGLRRISGPSGALREGQTIGNQQLSTAEKNTKANEKTAEVVEKVRVILDRNTPSSSTPSGTTSMQLSERP